MITYSLRLPSSLLYSILFASLRQRLRGNCWLYRLLLGCFLLAATQVYGQSVNPLAGSSRASYAGGVLFRAQCATCHGADATGISSIDAPDLTRMWQQRGYADADVFQIIRDGVDGTIMPPHGFTDTEIWMLVSFLRSVGSRGVAELPAGNVSNGQALFNEHCAECHRVGNSGGVLGPDLSDLLQRSTLEAIMLAIREPDALIAPGFATVRLTDNGRPIEGVLKNEDAFSLQIMTRDQRLQAFRKMEAGMEARPGSLMPAFTTDQLGDGEVHDILNYIRAVREDGL